MAQAFLVQKSGGGGVNQTLPEQVTAFHAAANSTPAVVLTWTNPTEYFGGVLIVKKIGSAPTSPTDGEKIYSGTAETFTDAGVQFDTEYFYRAFAYNAKKQYQTLYAVASAKPVEGIPLSYLPVGSLVKVSVVKEHQSRFGENVVWRIADQNHNGYPSESTTFVSEYLLAMMCFDAAEPNNSDANRKSGGNNRYLYSNVLQWANSEAAAGQWYTAQHSTDAPPIAANVYSGYNTYNDWAGFLAAFSDDFKSILLETEQITGLTNVDGGGYETVVSKMYLASATEIGKTVTSQSYIEGEVLSLFDTDDNINRIAYPTPECVANDEEHDTSVDSATTWILRTPKKDYSYGCINVTASSGNATWYAGAYYGNRAFRPFCNAKNTALVNPTPNADGSYTLIEEVA